jgi:cysteine-rich repeat protein
MRTILLAAALVLAGGCSLVVGFEPPAESGAQCTDGVDNDGNGVQDCDEPSCAGASGCAATCGDGEQAGVESCDDGNQDNTDACPDGEGGSCEPARCGDGFVQAGVEECDDANDVAGDGCEPETCVATCGAGTGASGRVYDAAGGRCYLGFTATVSPFAAHELCMGLGGSLAVPEDAAEDALVRAAAPASASIGLADFFPDDVYAFRAFPTDLPASYLHFTPGQPDAPLSLPVCVGYDGAAATWEDHDCDAVRPYVCEIHDEPCGDGVRQPTEECDDGNAFDSDGCTSACLDVDECALSLDNCSPDADCFNSPWTPTAGGFVCQCREGFTGDGVTCMPGLPFPTFEPRPPTTISDTLAGCTTSSSPGGRKIAIDGNGAIYAVMLCAGDVHVVVSTDAGATWTPPMSVIPGALDAAVVGIGPGRAVIAAALQNDEVVVRQTTDFGASWELPRTVFTAVDPVGGVSLTTDGTNILVGFVSQAGQYRVHRSVAPDLSSIPGVDTVPAVFGDVLLDPSNPTQVWAASDTSALHLRLSTDGGQTFAGGELTPPGAQEESDWAIGGGALYVTGARSEVIRIPTANPSTSQVIRGLPTAGLQARSITADPAGTVVVAQADIDGRVSVNRLPSGASMFDVPVVVDIVGTSPSATLAPAGLVAVVYTSGNEVRMALVEPATSPPAVGGLIHRWSFDGDALFDTRGGAHGAAVGGAFVSAGQLVLDGVDDHVATAPINASIGQRTLVAWVTVDNLTQQGGGVFTLEDPTPGNDVFDAIVFGESFAGTWGVGSDFGVRNNVTAGDVETETSPTLVMIAITYAADGSINVFRDGAPYVPMYMPGPTQVYAAGMADVLFGVRHEDVIGSFGTATGTDPYFAGAIEEARIYDRPLMPGEIVTLFSAGPGGL